MYESDYGDETVNIYELKNDLNDMLGKANHQNRVLLMNVEFLMNILKYIEKHPLLDSMTKSQVRDTVKMVQQSLDELADLT